VQARKRAGAAAGCRTALRARNRWLALLAGRLDVPCLATGNVHSHDRRRAPLQDALVAIGRCETLEESEPFRRGNSTSALTSPGAMAARFAEYPEAVAETERLAEPERGSGSLRRSRLV
jgi:error-prone DNA polymerase